MLFIALANQLFMALNTACCCVVEKLHAHSLTHAELIDNVVFEATYVFLKFLKPF